MMEKGDGNLMNINKPYPPLPSGTFTPNCVKYLPAMPVLIALILECKSERKEKE